MSLLEAEEETTYEGRHCLPRLFIDYLRTAEFDDPVLTVRGMLVLRRIDRRAHFITEGPQHRLGGNDVLLPGQHRVRCFTSNCCPERRGL